ncbi:GntR family transcriptional regulator [Nocardia sp. NPDC004711]
MSAGSTYLTLADGLEKVVRASPQGARLWSENELADQYGVSRTTVRGAMLELERRHLIRRTRGSGTFVARRMEYVISSEVEPSWSAMVRNAGLNPDTRILDWTTMRPSAEVRNALELSANDRVVRIQRLGLIDEQPATVTTSYLPTDLARKLREALRETVSFYSAFRALGLAPRRVWNTAEMAVADEHIAGLLEYEGRPAIWRILNCNEDAVTGRRLQFSIGWNRPDVYAVRLELGRQR